MKHILIAGNGFVGKVIARMVHDLGWKVTTLSRSGEGDVHIDLSDAQALQQWSETIEPPSHIVHCASAGGGGIEAYRSVYYEGVKNLTQAFPLAHLLFTSSTSVYPQVDGSVVEETSATEQNRATGKILLEAEQCVLEANGTVARLAGVYGVGRSYLLRRLLAGQAVIEEEGKRWLNHIHHEDAATAVLHLLEKDNVTRGEIYNVCDSTPKTQRDTYRELGEIFQLPMPVSAPRNVGSKRGWSDKAISNQKIRALGWEPKYPEFTRVAAEIAQTL